MVRGHNQRFNREHNRSLLLTLIRDSGQISRSELARKTQLSKPVIGEIIDELIQSDLITEGPKGLSRQGRKPILLRLNRGSKFVVGIDLAREHVELIITDLSGKLQQRIIQPWTLEGFRRPSFAQEILHTVRAVIRQAGISAEKILGIGIAHPFPLSHSNRILVSESDQAGWDTIHLREFIQAEMQVPVFQENDANVAALYEQWYGCAREFEHFLFVLVGNGVGCGLIVDGNVYRGADGMAGEIGHMTIDKHGPVCKCGRRGCLEALVSIPRLVESFRARSAESDRGGAATRGVSAASRGYDDVCVAVEAADPVAMQLLQDMVDDLAVGIASMVNVMNPQAVVVGGEIAKLGNNLGELLTSAVRRNAPPLFADKCRTLLSRYDESLVAKGAAVSVLKHFFRFPQQYIPKLNGTFGAGTRADATGPARQAVTASTREG